MLALRNREFASYYVLTLINQLIKLEISLKDLS
jgi:hypothetical protein